MSGGNLYLSDQVLRENVVRHLDLSKLYRRTAKREQAQEHLATATTMYREMGMTYWLEKGGSAHRVTVGA